jgi:hypothetical protein
MVPFLVCFTCFDELKCTLDVFIVEFMDFLRDFIPIRK